MAAETDPRPPTAPVFDLVRRAQQGDRSAVPGLRKLLDADPELWRHYGDLAGHAKSAWLDLLAGPDLALREAAERKVAELEEELAGPDPSPLERVLAQRAAACWVQVHHADALYARAAGSGVPAAGLRELLARQESAHRKLLAAIKQLAVVRKLIRPGLSAWQVAMGTAGGWSAAPASGRAAVPAPRLVVAN
ncbi:MAG TPA: hypothetical protein VM597_40780 [Gemmataceae bacterium]|nr:hypothetical protein [Gemmataceae bacterium]